MTRIRTIGYISQVIDGLAAELARFYLRALDACRCRLACGSVPEAAVCNLF
jgi:hypothetical protein